MEPRRPANRRIIVGILIACVVLLVAGPRIKPVATALSPVYEPVDTFVSTVTGAVGTFAGSLVKAPGLQGQNEKLQTEIARYREQEARVPLYLREIAALNSELRFSDLNPHLNIARADLIGDSPAGLGSVIQVNAGSDNGLHVNDPVLDQNGYVIGKVVEVSPAACSVGLLTDFTVNVPAMDAETGAIGLVEYRNGSVTLSDVEAGRRMRVGDFVVTSSIGNEYPIGELIGQISSLQGGNSQALNSAAVSTAAQMSDIRYVQIITSFGPGASVHYGKGSGVP